MVSTQDRASGAGAHVVKIYDDDADLVRGVGEFLAEGVATGDLVIVITTAAHRERFERALAAIGVDVAASASDGRYVVVDAAEMLSTFLVDGVADSARFNEVVGGLLERAGPRPVRIVGEMVSLLWDQGNLTAAMALEDLWNEFATRHVFSLYCVYAASSFESASDLAIVRDVCQQHTDIVPPDRYESMPEGPSDPGFETTTSELFVPVPLAIRAVRRFVASTLQAWGETDLLEDAAIVASELATNAVRHARSPFRVSMSRIDGTVKLMVRDGSEVPAEPRPLTTDLEGGRGLTLVAALCPSWGTERTADGKVVWAELATRA